MLESIQKIKKARKPYGWPGPSQVILFYFISLTTCLMWCHRNAKAYQSISS